MVHARVFRGARLRVELLVLPSVGASVVVPVQGVGPFSLVFSWLGSSLATYKTLKVADEVFEEAKVACLLVVDGLSCFWCSDFCLL